MARARNIKPGFFTNEDLVELSFETRLLFIGLWTLADREGRLEDRPKKIKIGVFPADDVNVDGMLQELHRAGFVFRYEVDGARYVQIANWHKHQNPHHTEKASEIPGMNGELTVKTPSAPGVSQKQDGGNLADSLIPDSLIPDSLIPDSKDTPPPADAGAEKVKPQKSDYTPEFEQAWAAYPSRPGNSKKDAFKAWSARVKAGASAADLIAGVERYSAYCKTEVSDPRYIKQAATFFGTGEHYLEAWTPVARGAPPGRPGAVRHNGFEVVDYRKGVNDDGSFE